MGRFRKSITNGSLWLEGLYSDVDPFDLFGVQTQYKVKILSNPTVNGDRMTFRGRIIDNRMAHEVFLPDPCDDSIASDVSVNQAIANLHSLITVKNPDDLAKTISRDDIIIVSLDTGDNDTKYNLQNARFIKIHEKFGTNRSTNNAACIALKDLPYTSAGTGGGAVSYSSPPYNGPLTQTGTDKNGNIIKSFGQWNVGASPPGFWEEFSKKFQEHVNGYYPELGLRQDNLGATRDLAAAANASNPARASGSKHGLALAKDHYLHTRHREYTSFREDNKVLAKDQKFVDAILSFMASNTTIGAVNITTDLLWGGIFGRGGAAMSIGDAPVGRGILEFHHFEFKSNKMPLYMEKYREQLAQIGFTPEELTSTSDLKRLYMALL